MMAKSKVLLVHSSAGLYGADRCLVAIARELVGRGTTVHVAVPEDGALVGMLASAGARVHLLDTVVFRREMMSLRGMVGMVLRAPVSVLRLARLIRREKIGLVHTNTGVTVGGALAARLCRVPHVWHFRDILTEFKRYLRFYEPFVDLFSTRIIFITVAVRDHFSSEGIKRKGVVIYDGIPVQDFQDTAPEAPIPPLVVTTVGRLAPYKGQDYLIRALAKAAGEGLELEAYVVGDVYGDRHAFRMELMALADEQGIGGRVHFEGFQEQVQPYLEKCNIFVMPSTRPEPLGIVILEAMAAGRAVISTDGGGAVEILEDGVTGVLVPSGNSDKMAAAITDLAKNDEKRLGIARRGKEVALADYSEEKMAASVADLFEEVINVSNQ
ncbi:MAG: glycosyltransferase [Actinobacteria bacterium]|nr:glycosyltransferase [Actinomycetota bacterium]